MVKSVRHLIRHPFFSGARIRRHGLDPQRRKLSNSVPASNRKTVTIAHTFDKILEVSEIPKYAGRRT